jgi:hypothetical protein
LASKYKRGTTDWLALSPSELRDLYFYGIHLTAKDGTTISDSTYDTIISSAQKKIEAMFAIKLTPQIIQESISFYRDDFEAFGYVRSSYPIVQCFKLDGYVGTIKQIDYPVEWLSIRASGDGETFYRQLYLVPNQGAAQSGSLVYNGIVPYLGILGYSILPNYWQFTYCTGYSKLPYDLLDLIGKMAAVDVFAIAGDLILNPGISSQSLGIDGLSQSASISSGSAFQNRIKQYQKDIDEQTKILRSKYKGITMLSL